jgi:hypothetical protein
MRRDIDRFGRIQTLVCATQFATTVVFWFAECAGVRGLVVRFFDYLYSRGDD